MKYKDIITLTDGTRIKQVTKSYAEKVYNAFLPVLLLPKKCEFTLEAAYCQIVKDKDGKRDFNSDVSFCKTIHCTPQLGKDFIYFVEVSEPKETYCLGTTKATTDEYNRISEFLYNEHYQLWKTFVNKFYCEEKERVQFRKVAQIGNFKVMFCDGIPTIIANIVYTEFPNEKVYHLLYNGITIRVPESCLIECKSTDENRRINTERAFNWLNDIRIDRQLRYLSLDTCQSYLMKNKYPSDIYNSGDLSKLKAHVFYDLVAKQIEKL